MRALAAKTPSNREARIAVARAAIDAHEWSEARSALEPLVDDDLSERVCVLMARVEKGEKGDTGRVRQWLARAVAAPRDPTWVADNQASNSWAPVSPVTGELDTYEWREAPEPPQRAADAGWLAEIVSSVEVEAGPLLEAAPIASAPPEEPEPRTETVSTVRAAAAETVEDEPAGPRTLELRAGYSGPGRQQASAEDRAGMADVAVSNKRGEGHAASEPRPGEVRPAAVLVRREAAGEAVGGQRPRPMPARPPRRPPPTGPPTTRAPTMSFRSAKRPADGGRGFKTARDEAPMRLALAASCG